MVSPQADLRPSTLVSALRDEKKDHLSGLGKAISTIKDHIVDSLGKTAPEMWAILEDRFQPYLANEHIHRIHRRLHEEII